MRGGSYWILFLMLLLPLLVSIWIFQGEPHYERLDILGPVETTDEGDTVHHKIPDFELTNQHGEPFSLDDTDGSIFVANFIFTRCPKECPVMTSNMRRVQNHFGEMDNIKFLSFSIDPNYDTPEVLHEFADRFNIDHDNWHFLTGDKDKIHDLAKDGFFVTVKEGDRQATDYLHSELFLLIDRENRLRGVYNGMNEAEISKLKDEILVLQYEYN